MPESDAVCLCRFIQRGRRGVFRLLFDEMPRYNTPAFVLSSPIVS